MAKGSVRKKGKKWYYRFYVEDQSGNLVQKEYAGTESKSETEKLLRQAMDDYDNKKFGGLHRQQRGIAVAAAGQHNALDIEDFRRGEDSARLRLQVGVLLSHQLRQAHDLAAKGAVEIHLVHA